MKYLSLNFIISFVKFCVVYLLLGSFAFTLITICGEIEMLAKTGWNIRQFIIYIKATDSITLIEKIRSTLLVDIPLSEVAEKMIGDSGDFVSVFMDFTDGERFSFNDMLSRLFPDTVKIIIANFAIYLFARINTVLSKIFSNFSFQIGIFISMGFLGVAGYSVSIAVLKLVDLYVLQNYRIACYIAIALLCFFLHSICLSGKGGRKTAVKRTIKHIGINLIFGVLNSILCWFVCFSLDGMYQFAKFQALLLSFVIFCVILIVEKEIACR